jgi:hypothetical protein
MLVQTIIEARLRTSQLGVALVISCLGVEPRVYSRQKIKRDCDRNLLADTKNSAAYGFYSGLPVSIAGQINFEVEVSGADCKALGIPRI